MINEHDITKRMLNVIRESRVTNEKNLLKEDMEPTNPQAIDDEAIEKPKQDGAIEVREGDYNTDLQAFKEEIDGLVVFDLYEVYPETRNVILSGKFSGISFQFNLQPDASGNGGLYVDTSNLSLGAETLEKLKRLDGYYQNWIKTWSTRLNEYKQGQNESLKNRFNRLIS